MDHYDYERVTSEIMRPIYERVHGRVPEPTLRHGDANEWVGASGFPHQIDASIEGPHRILLIECKHWEKPIGVEHVLTFVARIHDIRKANPSKDIHAHLVTKTGFTQPLRQFAEHYSITCDVIPDAGNFAVQYEGLIDWIVRPDSGALAFEGQAPTLKIGPIVR